MGVSLKEFEEFTPTLKMTNSKSTQPDSPLLKVDDDVA